MTDIRSRCVNEISTDTRPILGRHYVDTTYSKHDPKCLSKAFGLICSLGTLGQMQNGGINDQEIALHFDIVDSWILFALRLLVMK